MIAPEPDSGLTIPHIDGLEICPDYADHVPAAFARRAGVVVLRDTKGIRYAVCQDGEAAPCVASCISRHMGSPVRPRVLTDANARDQIGRLIASAYEQSSSRVGSAARALGEGALDDLASKLSRDLLDRDDASPVVRLVDVLLFDAVRDRASDIHIEPGERELVARTRIDGVMREVLRVPNEHAGEIVGRMKVLAGMDVAQKRLPQDGRVSVRIADREVDLRVASMPTCHGERVVMRLLDKSRARFELSELGMPLEIERSFNERLNASHGIILVTGPTGSGKTTTLYAALSLLNTPERNIMTLEDPIEYRIHGIAQTQINELAGLTFARGLRSMLRQDPDVIMVGEIRDPETASMAVRSALTGHLVLSTLHTNDASSAATRLLDLGIEPYLVSGSLLAVLAQRLVHNTCPGCPADPCPQCGGRGTAGRRGVFELLTPSQEIRELINARSGSGDVRAQAKREGMVTLDAAVRDLVERGLTDDAESARITMALEA